MIADMQPVDSINKIVGLFLGSAIVGAYPAFSAFVTFRSPRKVVLTALGVIFNTPIALIGLFSYANYDKANWLGELPLIISEWCGSFVIAWMIFLIARLTVKIQGERTCESPSLEQTVLSAHT
jgi:hypothetical protein